MTLWNRIKTAFSLATPPEAPCATPAEPEQPPSPAKHTRSDHEKSLIAEFRTTHAALLEKLEDAVYDVNLRMKKAEEPIEKAVLCRKTIAAYEKLKTVCSNTGPGGALYFEDMWEHCSNSANPDFRFIEPVEAALRELEGLDSSAAIDLR